MIAVSLSNASLILGARAIFKNLFWEIHTDQRVGLIGPNGAGKSSLFRLILGEHTPEPGGAVVRAKGITLGYLPQDPELDPTLTVLTAALQGHTRLVEVEAELARIEGQLATPVVYNNPAALTRWLAEQEKYLKEFAALEGQSYAERVQATLRGLGLSEADFDKPLGALSGGQKKLVALCRLLMARPSVLLLDEPDNHLDLSGKAFLERLINEYPGAVVLISHDRYLLDAVVTHIVEIEDGQLSTFAGDYTAYIVEKAERLARQEELYQLQQREITRLEAARKRYATWVIFNDKFASRLRAMEARLNRIEKLERPVLERKRMALKLNGWRGSDKALELTRVSKAFGEAWPLKEVNLLVRHGERVGLIGANGAGKSVLLRLLMRQAEPDAGTIRIGPSVRVGYYAQEHETLNPAHSPLEAVRQAARITEESAVAFLRKYLFTYQQTSQKINQLSGGERSRLQLALLVLSDANCLLLDEPTNTT